jgi:predicted tellurium resistance membrane protein TerC
VSWLTDPQVWASLVTLTFLEIVLGIDNLVFVALLAGRLPTELQQRARMTGLTLAIVTRLALLASINGIIGLTQPAFEMFGRGISWRDVVLFCGGLFLLFKGTSEIHESLEGDGSEVAGQTGRARFLRVVLQIMLLDIVFSLDSVITAVGMSRVFAVIAVGIMMAASGPLAAFISRHPTVKMLALSFLLLIGTMLMAEAAGFEVPKGYIYAAIGFSIGVEALNQLAARGRKRTTRPGERGEESQR